MISTAEAARICADHGILVSAQTVRDWCERYSIGVKIGGRWHVDRTRLLRLLRSDHNE